MWREALGTCIWCGNFCFVKRLEFFLWSLVATFLYRTCVTCMKVAPLISIRFIILMVQFDGTPMKLDTGNSIIRPCEVVARCLQGITEVVRGANWPFLLR